MRELFPIALLYAWIQVIAHLFLSQNAFFALTMGWRLGTDFGWFRDQLHLFSNLLLLTLYSLFVTGMVQKLWKRSKDLLEVTGLSFVATWTLIGSSSMALDRPLVAQPAWLLYALFVFFLVAIIKGSDRYLRRWPILPWIIGIGLVSLAYQLANGLSDYSISGLFLRMETLFSTIIGDGPVHYFSVLTWSLLGPLLLFLGLPIPKILTYPSTDFESLSLNIEAILSKKDIPYPFTLYTIQAPFALVGGVGVMMGLYLAIYSYHKFKGKNISKAFKWSFLPLLLNQPLPFLLTVPVFFQPLVLVPMILSTLVLECLTILLIHFQWLRPTVYQVPDGTPSVLFGYLASNGDIRYLIYMIAMLLLSVAIYWPFVARMKGVGK